MSFSHACASPFWFPDTVLLCALLVNRPRNWWIFVLAPLPLRLFDPLAHHLPPWFLLTTFALDSAKGVVLAATLRLYIKNPARMETVGEFGLFCFYAVLLVPAASAFGGAAARHAAAGVDYWAAWTQWFMGDALTHLVVTPAILYWLLGAPWKMRMPARNRMLEGGLVAVGLLVTGYLAFSTGSGGTDFAEPLFYAPVPLLFWAAIRFGMPGASGGIAVITLFAVNAAIHGTGPFAGRSPAATALVLQEFLVLRAAPLYLVGILIHQNTNVERRLRESETSFAHQLMLSQENERKRIASELHDGLGQDLLVIKNRLSLLAAAVDQTPEAAKQLRDISASASQAIGDVRSIAQALRPTALEQVGLTSALEWMVEQVRSSSTARVAAEIENIDGVLTAELEMNLYRIVQEALTNAVKHASANQIIVEVKRSPAQVAISILDDGRGFDPGHPQDGDGGSAIKPTLGLMSMAERAKLLAGQIEIQTARGIGTRVTLTMPLPPCEGVGMRREFVSR